MEVVISGYHHGEQQYKDMEREEGVVSEGLCGAVGYQSVMAISH